MKLSARLPATAVVTAVLLLAGSGCGHRGDPLPPRRRTPPGLAEFRLAQRGKALEVSLLTPATSVDGIPYDHVVVEILFAEGSKDLEKAGEKRQVLTLARQRLVETLPLPAPGTIARVSARAVVGRERGPRTLTMALVAQNEVEPPRELRARLVAGGVRLAWAGDEPKPVSAVVLPPRPPGPPSLPPGAGARPVPPGPGEPPTTATPAAPTTATPAAPATATPAAPATATPPAPAQPPAATQATAGATQEAEKAGEPEAAATSVQPRKSGFFVYRRVGTESYRLPLSQEPLEGSRTTDASAPLDATVCYVVRAAASVDPLVESAASNEACLEVRDLEPPAAPSGLAVLPRERGLEALWTPSPEEDLAGYRVYRQAAGEPRKRIGELEAGRVAFLDTSARPGVVYQYEVSAFDRAGNESPPTPAVEASLP